MLSSNIISWEYIRNYDLSFLQPLHVFSHAFVYTSSFSGCLAMSTEEQMMNKEQWIILKFLVWLRKTLSQPLEMLQQVYGDNISCTCVFEWHKKFREEYKKVKEDSRSRPLTSRTEVSVERVRQVVSSNHRLTDQMITSQLDMKKGQCLEDYHQKFGHAESLCSRYDTKQLLELWGMWSTLPYHHFQVHSGLEW